MDDGLAGSPGKVMLLGSVVTEQPTQMPVSHICASLTLQVGIQLHHTKIWRGVSGDPRHY